MRLPQLHGLIKRRLLINFRVEPDVMRRYLPAPFRPKLHEGHAVAGVCLIRLENIRPAGFPNVLGLSSENAAHRVAVEWDGPDGQTHDGVYIPRRDTNSSLNTLAGGRVFPGVHQRSDFEIIDGNGRIALSMSSRDTRVALRVQATETSVWPTTSCFASLAESSAFFERGAIGYSATSDPCHFDGLRLETEHWAVQPLAIDSLEDSFFQDAANFPAQSVSFDHALLMRNIPHRWLQEPSLSTPTSAPA